MKIIFLDIDGVLNTHHSMTRGRTSECLHHFQKSCVRELNRLIRLSGAKIVVSSTWRKGKRWPQVIQHIKTEGVIGQVIDRTGVSDDRIRGHEIAEWLEMPNHPEVESFVILDDDSNMDLLMDRLVLTSMNGGLRRHHVDSALEILERRAHDP